MNYTLQQHGDWYEQKYYALFIAQEFLEYEKFWQTFVTPVTNRSSNPTDIHFQSNEELSSIQKTPNDLCISQLHYTILLHLIRVYDIRQIKPFLPENGRDLFTEAFARFVGAIDCADELLERFIDPTKYPPWTETEGLRARTKWRKNHGDPLKTIRNYRNKLLHGRVPPTIIISGSYDRMRFPKVGKQNQYIDWRIVTSGSIGSNGTIRKDFDSPNNIIDQTWLLILKYLRKNWSCHLLKSNQ
ncbi:MAG: hypothetical protein HZC01_02960 [Candidatus Kerfeldbacteria bacterium]|nr:hypothetical protein [Candidatus Kerfeldbacteria bacterium]